MTYHNGTPTSIDAAKKASPTKAQQDRRALVQYIANMGASGASDDDILRNLPDIHPNAIRARRQECQNYRLITNALGVVKKTASGRNAVAYHITAKGLTALGLDPNDNWHSETKVA